MIQERNETALATLPNSLRTQLERANNLLSQSEHAAQNGDTSLALVKAREGLNVLKIIAQNAPNNATLALLAECGYRGFELETTERIDAYQLANRSFLGLFSYQEVVSVPTVTTRTIRGRVF